MIDREKVIKGLECCLDTKKETKTCARDCSYFDSWQNGCVYKLMHDALELLKADQAELIRQRECIESLEGLVDQLEGLVDQLEGR